MKSRFLITSLVSFFIFTSCNSSSENKKKDLVGISMVTVTSGNNNGSDQLQTDQQIPFTDQQITSTDSNPTARPVKLITTTDWDKKIIKNAFLTVEVGDFKKYNEAVYKTVKQSGGYIAQEDQNLSPGKNETVITIKVPVSQFETIMNELPAGGNKVIERKISTDDVTGKIVDTKSRLEAKKEMRLKYLEFLKQSKNMKEILEVQTEVNSIQEEIEAAAGQLNFLSHQSAFSTITLTFYQLLPGYQPGNNEGRSFFKRMTNALKSGTVWISDLLIGIASVWPLLLIFIGGLFFVKKILAKKTFSTVVQTAKEETNR